MDTGADVSLVKKGSISLTDIRTTDTINLNGIGQGTITTKGIVTIDLKVDNILIAHDFHIVDDNFPIPSNGILGLDFIKHYNCILDYQHDNDWIILRPNNSSENFAIPIHNAPKDNSFSLPARSEVIRSIKIQSLTEDILIPNQMISEGIFIANTIVNKSNPYVRIVNTTDENVVIDYTQIKTENLNDYEFVNLSHTSDEKSREKLDKLSKNFPNFIRNELEYLCSKYIDVFALESDKISVNNFYKQKLRLKDLEPVYIKNYRLPHTQKDEIYRQVDKLIQDDIVEPSASAYNSPILLVPKKSLPGSQEKRWRLVVDYRQINKKLIADKFPLPRIDDILDQLGRAKFFSCLDLMSGFHQVELEEESRDITSFSTDKGSFRFKRLPYGVKIAPNSFQRMMSLAFSGLTPGQAFLYMDDLVVIGCSKTHMMDNLEDVFKVCRKYNLKLHPEKCSFFSHEVTFLGHKCTDKGILPDDGKYTIIKNYPTPVNSDEAKRFVAFCNYYRRFIPNFAELSRHITRLTRKNTPFFWTVECENAFQYLKTQLMSPNILQYPDYDKSFCITTDASKYACGAVLSQEHDGVQLPISYASRAFTKGESNKSTIEQELTAIHWAIKFFRPYIYGKRFLVRSDHRPLTYLFSLKNPSSKLTRMRLDLEEFDFVVQYLSGKENYVADALSRINFKDIRNIHDESKINVVTRHQFKKRENEKDNVSNTEKAIARPKIYEALNKNEFKRHVALELLDQILYFRKGRRILCRIDASNLFVKEKIDLGRFFSRLIEAADKQGVKKLRLSLNDNIFKYTRVEEFKETGIQMMKGDLTLVLTPRLTQLFHREDTERVIKENHDNPVTGGHPGIRRTLQKIQRRYVWKNMTQHIRNYVKGCMHCKKNKITRKTRENLILTPTPRHAFDTVLIDTIGPLPKTEKCNEYAITVICDLTKYLVVIPVKSKHANVIAKGIFEKFILTYGPMQKIITDMGTEYKNQIFQEICKLLKIENSYSTPYHHQTLGTVERSHRTFNDYMRAYISVDRNDWDDWCKYFQYCYNTTPSVTHGYCPFELVFGRIPTEFDFAREKEPCYNIEAYDKEIKFKLQNATERARLMIERTKEKQKKIYDKRENKISLEVGDLVLVQNEVGHKLDSRYIGPYKVISIDYRNNCTLQKTQGSNSKNITVHKDRLKKL